MTLTYIRPRPLESLWRAAILKWQSIRADKSLSRTSATFAKAYPEIGNRTKRINQTVARHGKVKHLYALQRADLHDALRFEIMDQELAALVASEIEAKRERG